MKDQNIRDVKQDFCALVILHTFKFHALFKQTQLSFASCKTKWNRKMRELKPWMADTCFALALRRAQMIEPPCLPAALCPSAASDH